jgi:hypothetical protein
MGFQSVQQKICESLREPLSWILALDRDGV